MKSEVYRPPLKWAGGKFAQLERLRQALPAGKRLVEPFVGGGSVFMGTDYSEYLLSDINPDLIGMYQAIQRDGDAFVAEARQLFKPEHNTNERYLAHRDRFNNSVDAMEKAVLFLYLNRHGFNGLCRYNLKGGYNVSFGKYKQPYFPERELLAFAEKAQRATFVVGGFGQAFDRLQQGDVVYCDPPYLPLSATANFTAYSGVAFDEGAHRSLAECAADARSRGFPVVVSNHDTEVARAIYHRANRFDSNQVTRTISCNTDKRNAVGELLIHY